MKQVIKIKPFDTLYFRTGRPFTMGSETWADIMFPPSPSTFYGAIRSFLIFQRGGLKEFEEKGYEDIGKIIKDKNGERIVKKGTLRISGLFLYKSELLFPSPLDLVEKDKKEKDKKLIPLTLINRPKIFISDYPLKKVLIYKPKEKAEEPSGWLTSINFKDYLKNRKKEFNFLKHNELYLQEPKIGIAREPETLTSKEGHLYRIPMIRLNKKVSFVLEIDDLSDKYPFPEEGIFQLGGEGRGVRYEIVEKSILNSLKNLEFKFENNLFKIYLATPAIFENGWFPKWIKDDYSGEYKGLRIKLIACAIGRPLFIGGWDMAKNSPKSMQKAVPPGSVYYFEVVEGSIEKIKENFHFKNISDVSPEEGFGLSIVGEVKL